MALLPPGAGPFRFATFAPLPFGHGLRYPVAMTRLRPILGLLLALLMAVTSVTMAVARGQSPMSSQEVELCIAGSAQTVSVDASGKPITPRHPCPECTLGMTAFTLVEATAPLLRPATRTTTLRPAFAPAAASLTAPAARARGPPTLS